MPSNAQLQAIVAQNQNKDDNTPESGAEFLSFLNKTKEFTPFSSKQDFRESDTPHSTPKTTDETEPNTTLLPGDRKEMTTFCEQAKKSSKIQIKVSLPVISVQLK